MTAGYNFKSLEHIAPYVEAADDGITSAWARDAALKYECTVIVGYPETVDLQPGDDTGYYNSALVMDSEGEIIGNYRKSHLYYTDETWAQEGTGFMSTHLPKLGKTALGICMDLK